MPTSTAAEAFSPGPLPASLAQRRLRGLALHNLLRMGHCAPAVMKTLLDAFGTEAPWLVRLVAALPGGIGNGGNECGGITAPLVLLGLLHARDPEVAGLPAVVHQGRCLLRLFASRHGSTSCRDILGHARLPLRCMGVVRHAPGRFLEVRGRGCQEGVMGERRELLSSLDDHFQRHGFHCAQAALERFLAGAPPRPLLRDAMAGFVGGTAYAGLTCSALTAGVMLIGLELGEIEDSRLRVLRMIGTMALGGNAFDERLNAFNRPMNLGHELVGWFAAVFGETQCRALTGCDFGTAEGARRYVEGGCLARCREMATAVGDQARAIVAREKGRGAALSSPAPRARPPPAGAPAPGRGPGAPAG